MHVCLICDEYPPAPHGGNGSLYCDLAESLVAAGHRVTVVGVYPARVLENIDSNPEPVPGLRVVRLQQSAGFLGTAAQLLIDRYRLKRWLKHEHRRSHFDLIECADYAGWLCFGGPRGVRTVVRIGGANFFFDHELGRRGYGFEYALERACLARATDLASVSGYAGRRTLELCGSSNRECQVIYNSVDTALFSPDESVKIEPGLVVYVNTLNPKKGIEQLLDAMFLVFESHPQARLAVIGHDTQRSVGGSSYLGRLQERVPPGYRSRVDFMGRLDRRTGVVQYLRKAQVCCYPSHMETFGIAPVEAMSVGKPTIYSKTGPGPEIIEDGVSGLLCEPLDPQDIARKISALLDDDVLAARLGRSARQRALSIFDKADWITRNIDFYESCLRNG